MISTVFYIFIGFAISLFLFIIFFFIILMFQKGVFNISLITSKEEKEIISSKTSRRNIFAILITSLIFICGVLIYFVWVNANTMVLMTTFKDVDLLNQGAEVLYRGVNIGFVNEIYVSDDSRFAVVKIRIPDKGIKIYEGSTAEIFYNNIAANQALVINPPEQIDNRRVLKNGGTIRGLDKFTFKESQNLALKMLQEGTIEKLVTNLNKLVDNTGELTNDINQFNEKNSANINELIVILKQSLVNSNILMNTGNKTLNSFRATTTETEKLVKSTNSLVLNTNNLVKDFGGDKDNPGNKEKTKASLEKINNAIDNINELTSDKDFKDALKKSVYNLSDVLVNIQDITDEKEVRESLKKTILESSANLMNLNCVSEELSKTISKRFLIPRFIFGKPAAKLNKCYPSKEK